MSFYTLMKEHQLNTLPIWGVSHGIEKEPLNVQLALQYNFDPKTYGSAWGKFCNDPATQLATLDELYNCPNTPLDWINMYANTLETKLLLFDIENRFDQKWLPMIKKLPVIYAEKSVHGGIHLIVPVSSELLTDPKYQKLWAHSSKKVAKLGNEKHTGIEILIYKHYLTFTQNKLDIHTHGTQAGLKEWLDYLVEQTNMQINQANKSLFTTNEIGGSYRQTISNLKPTYRQGIDLIYQIFKRHISISGFNRYSTKVYQSNLKDNSSEPDWSSCEISLFNHLNKEYSKFVKDLQYSQVLIRYNDLNPDSNDDRLISHLSYYIQEHTSQELQEEIAKKLNNDNANCQNKAISKIYPITTQDIVNSPFVKAWVFYFFITDPHHTDLGQKEHRKKHTESKDSEPYYAIFHARPKWNKAYFEGKMNYLQYTLAKYVLKK